MVFDLDGVLFDSKQLHYSAFNQALAELTETEGIDLSDHHQFLDGLPTRRKLDVLATRIGLDEALKTSVYNRKQELTRFALSAVSEDKKLAELLSFIRAQGIPIAVASNSIRATVEEALSSLGVMGLVDLYLGNEDVSNPKPHPEMYWKCMSTFAVMPHETLIFEDSKIGREAALHSGGVLVPVDSRTDLTLGLIERNLEETVTKSVNQQPWVDPKLNVLIPMAGRGSRFEAAGFTFPKPLIEVRGKPMIQKVVENLNIRANFIFLVQAEHYDRYQLKHLLELVSPGCTIIQVDGVTEGAASTTLLARDLINNSSPLLIANSDQQIVWDSSETMYSLQESSYDGGILTFRSTHPKWSFARISEDGSILEVAEKKPISDIATTGIYYWKRGSDYVRSVEDMMTAKDKVNGEYYICPSYNHAIANGLKFRTFEVSEMWGIGTPEDLERYLREADF